MMTKQVQAGDVLIGGGAPVTIQSMTNTKTSDVDSTVSQIIRLTDAGCQIIRCAVPDVESANAISEIKKEIKIPLVADIHYNYELAIASIENGADKIRINPGNIGGEPAVKEIVKAAKYAGIPIRIGVNGGSLEKDILEKHKGVTPVALVESALRNVEMIENLDFYDIVVSIKTSNVKANYEAHKLLSSKTKYPLHIGITESGSGMRAVTKSAIGIGSLLMEGIGDTMRVSITGDPVQEVECAKDILTAVDLRKGSIDIISCPTCGRTDVNLENIVDKITQKLDVLEQERIKSNKDSITIAVMGCSVNGPGEAKSADYGVAFGKDKGVIFKKGEILKTVDESYIVSELIETIVENEK